VKRTHTVMTHFQLGLARIAQMGYMRSVSHGLSDALVYARAAQRVAAQQHATTSLSATPPIPSAGVPSTPAVSGAERSASALNSPRSTKAMYADYEDAKTRASLSFGKRQVNRTNRNPDQHRVHWREDWELTAEQRARRIANRRWQAKHREKQRLLAALGGGS
jgi:hypothetical protein